MNKKQVLTKYLENQKAGDDWIRTVPKEINDAFFDNPYTVAAELNNELLLKALFGELEASLITDFIVQDFCDDFNQIDTIDGFVEFICGGDE